MKTYSHKEIENKWQEIWEKEERFSCREDETKPKKYIVPMFFYPSGSMHMGHARCYTVSDVISRYWKNKGYNVCHPMGADSFGSPAENAAIDKGVHPKEWTDNNIKNMVDQMKKMGFSFDWSRWVSTCEEDYWKWEQKFFIDMWNAGYITRKTGIVNWDPVDETVISNEQVINGRGWRTGAVIEQKEMVQYYLKTTAFADEMHDAIDEIGDKWPQIITKQQKNFIKNGQTEGDVNIPFSDWCISRQKYWGTPIPMIHCDSCGIVPSEEFPVIPPKDVQFTGKGNPISNHPTWKICNCPKCGNVATKETDTMDTFVQSSWYFIRYISEFNGEKFDSDKMNYWKNIDYYIGGPEHAISHMIYSRFFWRVFKKIGYIPESMPEEPFDNVICQGMVKKDGKKMSKSAGNGVSPSEMIDQWGSDIVRMYIMFAGPVSQDIEWSDRNIIGISRFINKFWNNSFKIDSIENIENKKCDDFARSKIEMIKQRRTRVYESNYNFNTVIAAAMEVFNAITKTNNREVWIEGYNEIIESISPIAPHVCEEIKFNFKSDI